MKSKLLLLLTLLTSLAFTGCQNRDLSAENQALKQQISELEYELTQLEEAGNITTGNPAPNTNDDTSSNETSVSQNTAMSTPSETALTNYTLEELSSMVEEFVASVGSVTPDINNSGNLDQFFSLKRQGDQIEHALEKYENTLEDQYRAGTITREDFRISDRKSEELDDYLDSAFDRLEITFGIDD